MRILVRYRSVEWKVGLRSGQLWWGHEFLRHLFVWKSDSKWYETGSNVLSSYWEMIHWVVIRAMWSIVTHMIDTRGIPAKSSSQKHRRLGQQKFHGSSKPSIPSWQRTSGYRISQSIFHPVTPKVLWRGKERESVRTSKVTWRYSSLMAGRQFFL